MKKAFSVLLVFLLLCTTFGLGLNAAAEGAPTIVESGYCGGEGDGTNLTWTKDSRNTLTISGTGRMADFGYYSAIYSDPRNSHPETPWYLNRHNIRTVVIEDGVTSIGDHAFNGCTGLTSVTLPADVTSIGEYAFYNCGALASATLPAGLTGIGT
ncbi:MAG: leucine-rich repeat domain-containing protein [Clostridia bacterium]|nr:leucine-rich repeat domain-containing protein [Clostridia bacterium]